MEADLPRALRRLPLRQLAGRPVRAHSVVAGHPIVPPVHEVLPAVEAAEEEEEEGAAEAEEEEDVDELFKTFLLISYEPIHFS